ncbi:PHB depolymerase family esterase [Cupriavidus basilensis]|uniref:PHB depolymerase family esterase n=1 Tax=Cupriavidus basilensis TaxID=68895 RepID=A0ABT6AID5_9BURK|nr:PHB depolymerase family esterase [Cupriavidus basilensis]MDF3832364.1 PHB depolymerase family esterase [Cupriavidus basilensis]
MAKSLSADWHAQLRQLSRVQPQTARQLQTWINRIATLNPAVPRLRARSPASPPLPSRQPLPGEWASHHHRLAPLPGELVPRLSYWLYVPARAPKRPMPLVVMLHGCRQKPEDLAAGTRMNALAEREGFMVAYPQQPLRRQMQRCWQWFDLGAAEGGREAQALAVLIDALAARRDVRADQVYLAGLSAGASMAAVVALRYPEKVAAVGLHSGVVIGAACTPSDALRAMQHGTTVAPALLLDAAGVSPGGPKMPAIVLHGMADEAVHPVNARLLARQFLAYNGMTDRLDERMSSGAARHLAGACAVAGDEGEVQGAEATEAANGHEATPSLPAGDYLEASFGTWNRELVELCEVAGLDHAWSGGDGDYAYHAPIGPDASALMWEFFRQHRR